MANKSYRNIYKRNNRAFLYSIVLSLFEWELPLTCNSKILERDLLLTGAAAIFWDNTFKCFVNTQITSNGVLDMYGLPLEYECNGVGYRRRMPADSIAICYNSLGGLCGGKDNIVFFDLNSIIEQYSDLLTDIDIGIRNEIENTKHPAVITVADPKIVKTARELWRQATDGEPVIIADKEMFNGLNTQIFPLPRETYIADKQQAKNTIINEFLGKLGVESLAHEKAERLITAETDISQQSVSLPLQNMLIPRLECCRQFYHLYGEKITVKPRTLNTQILYREVNNNEYDS